MGDFNEHILFGLLTAAVTMYLIDGFSEIEGYQIIAASLSLLLGSVLPDIDHKRSKIHRSVRAVVSLALATVILYINPFSLEVSIISALIFSSLFYVLIDYIKIRHRGFTHSVSFLVIASSLTAISGSIIVQSALPGVAMAIGIGSHLLLDTEFKLS